MKKDLNKFTKTFISAAAILGVASLSGCSLNFAPSKPFSFSSDKKPAVQADVSESDVPAMHSEPAVPAESAGTNLPETSVTTDASVSKQPAGTSVSSSNADSSLTAPPPAEASAREAYFKTLNFQGYKYPIEKLLGKKFSENEHYQIRFVDEGAGTQAKHFIAPSNKNEIGNRNAVSDDNIFELNGKNLVYASFNDDWSIKETVEPVFDSQGVLKKTITVKYGQNGIPVSYLEH